MKKQVLFIILLCYIIGFYSCNLLNSTYKHANKEEQTRLKPLDIDFKNVDSSFLNKQDSNILFYSINADGLKEIISKNNDKYVLCCSFYYWCEGSRNAFDSIEMFANQNNLKLIIIETTDWLYQNNSRAFFKSKKFYGPILSLDIMKYGYNFNNRKRWRNFIQDVCGANPKKLYGISDVILFDSKGNVLLYGDFYDEIDKIRVFIKAYK